jgi:CTP:molybdopterin cytidylyltransferase MocA
VRCLHAAGVADVLVVVGHRADEVAAAARDLGARVTRNPDPAQGMFSSVRAGFAALAAIRPDGENGENGENGDPTPRTALVLPVDIPLVRPTTVALLLADHFPARSASAAPAARVLTYPRFLGERGHPPVIDAALFDAVLAHDGTGGLRAVLAAWEETHPESVGDVAVADAGVAMDMDRPEDYAAARAHLATPGPTEAECRALWDIASTPENVRAHCRAVAQAALRMALALNAARAQRGTFAEGPPETGTTAPAPGDRTGAHGAPRPGRPAVPTTGAATTETATAAEASVSPPSRAENAARPQPPVMARSLDTIRPPASACVLDPALVFGAALAHDVAKAQPRHARAGADLLARHGFAEAAAIVADHADLELAPDAPLTEREIVFLADKYVRGVEVVDMEERYAAKLERFGGDPSARAAVAGRLARAAEVRRRFLEESGARLPDLLLD